MGRVVHQRPAQAAGGFKQINDVIPQQALDANSVRYMRIAGFAKAQVIRR